MYLKIHPYIPYTSIYISVVGSWGLPQTELGLPVHQSCLLMGFLWFVIPSKMEVVVGTYDPLLLGFELVHTDDDEKVS